jgi:protocatechuate 3,4-dioxygenase beta subunit
MMKCACLILTLCFLAHGQTPAQAPPKGSIAGQVVNAKTGAPLKKTTVRLTMIVNANGRGPVATPLPAPGSPIQQALVGEILSQMAMVQTGLGQQYRGPNIRTVETDEQGHFSFASLDGGKYRLTAERQGFLRQNYGERKYSGGGTPIVLGDGQNIKELQFRMNPQAVITGKVLDEDGEPLANVQVRAHRYIYQQGKRTWAQVANATSSDIGEFRLPDLQPGRYLVSTNPRNLGRAATLQPNEPLSPDPDMTYAATYYPSTTSSTTAMPIDVGAGGEIRGIDIRLIKTRVWRVRGRVAGVDNAGGRGRSAVQVSLMPAEGPANNQLMSTARMPDGIFEIRNVPSGSYILHAQTQGNGLMFAASMPVQVSASHVDGLTMQLASGGDLQGTVKLVDADGQNIQLPNLSVMLRPAANAGFGFGGPGRAKVGDDMNFTIKGVPPMKFQLTVTGIPNTCYLKSVTFGGRDVLSDGLDMSAGGPVEVTISAAAAQVDAVVLDKDNKPAAGAVVAIIPSTGTPMVFTTDDNGILSAKGLKPGDYKLLAWEDVESGAPYDPDFLQQFEKKMKSVKLDKSGHEAVQLTAIAEP